MRNDVLLTEAEQRMLSVVEVSSLSSELVDFLDWVSELPVPWLVKYFDTGSELLDWLLGEGMEQVHRLVAVLPSDLQVPYEKLSPQLLRYGTKLLVLVGKAYRGNEDRNRKFYLRR